MPSLAPDLHHRGAFGRGGPGLAGGRDPRGIGRGLPRDPAGHQASLFRGLRKLQLPSLVPWPGHGQPAMSARIGAAAMTAPFAEALRFGLAGAVNTPFGFRAYSGLVVLLLMAASVTLL